MVALPDTWRTTIATVGRFFTDAASYFFGNVPPILAPWLDAIRGEYRARRGPNLSPVKSGTT